MCFLVNYGYSCIDDNGDGVHDFVSCHPPSGNIASEARKNPVGYPGFRAPGTNYPDFIDDATTTVNFRTDFEWQISRTHLAKTGLEIINHNIEKTKCRISSPS
jgi:hypothetical protein